MNKLFETVPKSKYMEKFISGDEVNARALADFLNLRREDFAQVVNIQADSIRYDSKISSDLKVVLTVLLNICEFAANYFEGDLLKVKTWFVTPNPMLGNVSPRHTFRSGEFQKLIKALCDLEGDMPEDENGR